MRVVIQAIDDALRMSNTVQLGSSSEGRGAAVVGDDTLPLFVG